MVSESCQLLCFEFGLGGLTDAFVVNADRVETGDVVRNLVVDRDELPGMLTESLLMAGKITPAATKVTKDRRRKWSSFILTVVVLLPNASR